MESLCIQEYITLLKSQAFELKYNFGNFLSQLCQLARRCKSWKRRKSIVFLRFEAQLCHRHLTPPFLSSLCFNFSFPVYHNEVEIIFIEHSYLWVILMTAPQNVQSHCEGFWKVLQFMSCKLTFEKKLSLFLPNVCK